MKSQHTARLSMLSTLIIGACAMFYIHVHRDDQPPPARYITTSQVASVPPVSADANTGCVELASHQIDAAASSTRVLIILDSSRPSSEPVVVRLQDSDSGQDAHIYTLKVVDSNAAEMAALP